MSEENNNSTSEHDDNKLIALRREKLSHIRKLRQAYPNNFRRDSYAQELQDKYADKSKQQLTELDIVVSIAGRIMARRGPFFVLQDMSGRIQAYLDRKVLDENQLVEIDSWDIGDIIGVSGPVSKSGKGDPVSYTHLTLPTKASV